MAGEIYRGNNAISAIYRGNNAVSNVYRGNVEVWSSAPALDADASAWIAQADASGASLSQTAKDAVNQLAIDLKATTGLWTNLRAIYPLVGNNNASCKYNLKDAATSFTYTLNFQGGWNYDSLGAAGNNTNTRAESGLSPSALNGLGTGAGLHIYLTTNPNSGLTGYDWGANEQSLIAGFRNTTLYARFVSLGGGAYITAVGEVPLTSVGDLYSAQNDGSTTTSNWKNGISVNTGTQTWNTAETKDWFLGNDNRGSINEYSLKGYGFAAISNYLDATQMTAFSTAVQTYNASLSR